MKYMMLIMGDETTMNTVPTVADTGMSEEFAAYHAALVKSGAWVGGDRLRPTSASTRVRVRDKKVGSSRVDLQACKLEYSIVSPK